MTRGIYQPVRVDVQVRGPVPQEDVDYVAHKVERVMNFANQSILAARAVLTKAQDPAMARPARAEATLDVNGTQVRAQAIASDMPGAIDLLEEKLRMNLVQLQDRERTRHRWIGVATEQGWRHGTLPTAREEYFPRPSEEREVVRRKTFAMAPMTPDEAAYEMGMLGHDFYLFTDSRSGKEAVVYRDGDGRFAIRGEAVPDDESASLVEMVGTAPTLAEAEAITRLELSGEPFVFYLDPEDGRGRVLYMRYDGHYGLITAA
ncbi:MAG TPA: HPF/RaiA family ribosome-associated protein [Nocardioidaceae bacterium]|nr:HPF/RaiA family ribosome-associated protein [Nocardioidaceae bacterium]